MTVLEEGKIQTINPENLRKLNFPLILSEEYGVSFQSALKVIMGFLLKVLTDNTITVEISEKIFLEILESFPTNKNKKDLGYMLLRNCFKIIKDNKSDFVFSFNSEVVNEKIKKLVQVSEIYNSPSEIWIP